MISSLGPYNKTKFDRSDYLCPKACRKFFDNIYRAMGMEKAPSGQDFIETSLGSSQVHSTCVCMSYAAQIWSHMVPEGIQKLKQLKLYSNTQKTMKKYFGQGLVKHL